MRSFEIKSKFTSKCSDCQKVIKVGQFCWWAPKSKRVQCTKCAGPKAKEMARRRSSIRNTWGGMTN